MTVWVTGGNGMLGGEVTHALKRAGITVVATDMEIDITDIASLHRFVTTTGPFEWIVNCAAWTAVDAAEDNEEAARILNADGPANLAQVAAETGGCLMHISTDYVFDGTKRTPYTPDDTPAPIGAYGRTKLLGEQKVQAFLDRHIIVRTAWLYSHRGTNFVTTMLRLMNERDRLQIVDDQYGAPTYAEDLATAIVSIVSDGKPTWGIYHYTDSGEISWYTFAEEIYRQGRTAGVVHGTPELTGIPSEQYPTKAHRPAYSVLSTEKICDRFGVVSPDWKASLSRFFTTYAEERYQE